MYPYIDHMKQPIVFCVPSPYHLGVTDIIRRDDVLPCRAYLRHCVLAAQNLGGEALESFLDNTFLVQLSLLDNMQCLSEDVSWTVSGN